MYLNILVYLFCLINTRKIYLANAGNVGNDGYANILIEDMKESETIECLYNYDPSDPNNWVSKEKIHTSSNYGSYKIPKSLPNDCYCSFRIKDGNSYAYSDALYKNKEGKIYLEYDNIAYAPNKNEKFSTTKNEGKIMKQANKVIRFAKRKTNSDTESNAESTEKDESDGTSMTVFVVIISFLVILIGVCLLVRL